MRKLVSEALAHVIIDVIGAQQLFKGLGCVSEVLGQNVAHAAALPHLLAQVGQLTGLGLDQRVKLTAGRIGKVMFVKRYNGKNRCVKCVVLTAYLIRKEGIIW